MRGKRLEPTSLKKSKWLFNFVRLNLKTRVKYLKSETNYAVTLNDFFIFKKPNIREIIEKFTK